MQINLKLTEPEALADFLLRGSASASGSMDCIGKFEFNRTGRINCLAQLLRADSGYTFNSYQPIPTPLPSP